MKNLGLTHEFVPPAKAGLPTLLMLHGTGGTEHDLLPLGKELLPGAALLSPRGKVLENGMPRFFRRLAEGVFDIEDLKLRTHELAEFIEAARLEYGLDGQILAVGYSNGANIAASLMLLRPGTIGGGVLLRAMPPFVPDAPADLLGTRVLLSSGRRDPIVRVEQTLELQSVLKTCGAEVALHWHEGGHELGQDDVTATRNWLTL